MKEKKNRLKENEREWFEFFFMILSFSLPASVGTLEDPRIV